MKKLMFGFAAALAMVACAEVESSNIVGYQTYELKNGFNLLTPVFTSCENDSYVNLSDLKLEGGRGEGTTEQIQILSNSGGVLTRYYWVEKEAMWGIPPTGWYTSVNFTKWDGTDEGLMAKDVKFNVGDGLYFNVGSDDVKLLTSGNIKYEVAPIEISAGFTAIGNCSAVPMYLQDIEVIGGAGQGTTEEIQILNETGAVVARYYWVEKEAMWGIPPTGWYTSVNFTKWDGTDEGLMAKGVKFEPGQGLYFQVGDNAKIKLPSIQKSLESASKETSENE